MTRENTRVEGQDKRGPRHARVLVGAHLLLLNPAGELLLGRRTGTGWADGWWHAHPAGHLDEGGESVLDAVVREAREELGVEVNSQDLRHVVTVHQRDAGASHSRLQLFFSCTRWSGTPRVTEPHLCDEIGWFSPVDLPPNLVPYTRLAIEAMARRQSFAVSFEDQPLASPIF
jgi:ADP-ribose pyrophosphatase YjhB (NUDIX family)